MSTSKVTAISATQVVGQASKSTKITEELLLCRLCSLKYSVHGRRPMALRCVHTFCECCLEQLLRDQKDDDDIAKNHKGQRRNKRQQLVCPTCETVTPLARGYSPSSLPVNPSIMELLEIFHYPTPVGRNETKGFSQVKVNTMTTRDGFVNPEFTTKSAQPSTNGNISGDTGSASQGHVNWVSTVNIGGSVQLEQQQQQQQQQRGAAFKLIPTAVTSAVTSFSTLRMQPEQSPGGLSSSDTNTGPPQTTSTLHADDHMCSRCGMLPATVSVASSSQTMVPQKLCSECWKQSASRTKQGGILYGGKTSISGADSRMRMNANTSQSVDGTVTTSRISTTKTSVSSGASAPTNDVVNAVGLPQTLNKDNLTAKPAVFGDRPIVTNGKSTIEVRRRSFIDNRSLAAATSTNSASMDSPRMAVDTIDEQVSLVPGSSVSEQPQSSVSSQQLPITISTSHDIQRRTDTISDTRGSNASARRNTDRITEHISLSRPSSAPTIAEVYPLLCSNPPYNPDFDDDAGQVWSSGHCRQRDDDSPPSSSSRPNLPASNTRDQERLQRKQQEEENLPGTTSRGMSFALTKSRYGYPPEQPPKYEDIIRETSHVTATAPDVAAGGAQTQPSPSFAPSSNEISIASLPATSAMKLVRSFGKYGEISTQPGVFQAPRRLSVSPDAMAATDDSAREARWTNCRIVVGDRANGTVQVFSETGECLSMLRADAVAGCCLFSHNQRLILATDRGVETYDINGSRQDSLPMGAVLNVVPYERGFIAVQSKSLSIFKGTSFSTRARTLTSKAKPGQFNRLLQFDDICDVAVNSQQDLVVLEAAAGGSITIMAEDGYIKSTISPSKLEGCRSLHAPTAVAVDSAHNIIVAESGSAARILLFGANGRLQRVLLGPRSQLPEQLNRVGAATTDASGSPAGPWPTGLAVSPDDRLHVAMRGDKFAEIRIYEYL